MLLYQCICFTILFGLTNSSHAQTLAQREFTIQDGLVQSQVDYLFKDSRGYLWITTRGGLNCFNGISFKTYNAPDKVAGFKFKAIDEDENGYLYFLNQNGVFRFDGVQYEQILPPKKRYRSLEIDNQGRLWLIAQSYPTYESLIDVFDLRDSMKQISNPLSKEIEFFEDQRWFCLIDGNEGHYVIGGNLEEWNILQPNGEIIHDPSFEFVINYYLRSICEPQDNFSCEFQISEDFFIQNEIDSQIFFKSFINFPGIKNKQLERGFTYINPTTNQLKIINFQDQKVLSFNTGRKDPFYRTYTDDNWRVWTGLETGFVQFFNPFALNYKWDPLNLCWNIVGLPNNNILFANHNDELIVFDGKVKQKFSNNCHPSITTFYMGNHQLSDGRVLLSCSRSLCILDSNFSCTAVSRDNNNISHSITSQHLTVDKNEEYVLTATYSGIDKFYITDSNITFVEYIEFDTSNLKHIYANCIHINEEKSEYWVGHEKGLSIYSIMSNEWRHYDIKSHTFPSGDVASIHKDPHGNYWLGTAHGLVFGNDNDGFELITDPLLFGVVNAIDSFDEKHIILGGSFGICVLNIEEYYDKELLIGKVFNGTNGFTAGEPAENAIYRLPDNSFMVGTQSHPVQLFPNQMDLSIQPLETRILGINDSLIPFTTDHAKIELAHKTENIRLDFEAIGMYRPATTRYSYQLNSGEWSDWQKESFVELTNLGSGDHTFAVKALTPGIDPSRIPVSQLSFTTSVPLWMEPWFPELLSGLLFASALLIGFMIFLNYRQRRRNLKNAYAIDYLRIQSLQAQMNPHFVFNVLGTLQNMILKADVHKANEQLVNLSTLIRRFLESTVQGNLKDNQSTIKEQSLEKEIELLELYVQFEQIQHEDVFDYSIEIDPELETESYSIPPMLIQPFVENAIKHGLMYKASKGFLKIRFFREENQLICVIEDNGVGRKKSRDIQKKSLRIYRSYGTELVEERINLLNKMDYRIEYFIEDRQKGGTRVILKLGS